VEKGSKIEVNILFEKSKDALSVAQLLMDHGKYTDAVSKSYYAMFYAACAVLRTKRLDTSRHSGVISLFSKYFCKEGLFDGIYYRKLKKAFEDRQIADYSITKPILEDVARQRLQDALEFNKKIEEFLKKENWL
jgi:uncharacterized protein (UPF0332 family)